MRAANNGRWMWDSIDYTDVKNEFNEIMGVESYTEMQQVLNGLNKELYPIKTLKKDLKSISDTFKIVRI